MNPKTVNGCTARNVKKRNNKMLARKASKNEKVRRFKWSEEDMEAAVGSVIGGSMSQREAAQKYSVPRATLQKIIKGKTFIGARPGKKNPVWS